MSWMSKQHLGVFLKISALAAFLVTPVCVQAQAPERCVPAVMSLSGEGEHDVAVLDVHGEWHVLSWEGVTWIARNTGKTPGEDALFSCVGSGKSDSSYV